MHKNILGLYGFFDEGAHLYLILEYMPHGTLYSIMKQTKGMLEEQAAKVIRQVA